MTQDEPTRTVRRTTCLGHIVRGVCSIVGGSDSFVIVFEVAEADAARSFVNEADQIRTGDFSWADALRLWVSFFGEYPQAAKGPAIVSGTK